jgi:hypothetical protein
MSTIRTRTLRGVLAAGAAVIALGATASQVASAQSSDVTAQDFHFRSGQDVHFSSAPDFHFVMQDFH